MLHSGQRASSYMQSAIVDVIFKYREEMKLLR